MKRLLFVTQFIVSVLLVNAQSEEAMPQLPKKEKKQIGIGLKAGYNYSSLTGKTPSIDAGSKSGFMIAGFYAPPSRGILGYRSEIIYSRQGFSFDASGNKQNVTNNYIYMPHFTTISIGKVVQLQLGGQVGYLLNAKTSGGSTTGSENITSYYNRFDYGAAGGLEVYPFKGLILGSRYNISFGNMFSNTSATGGGTSPIPFNEDNFKGKNAVLQFFAGYKF